MIPLQRYMLAIWIQWNWLSGRDCFVWLSHSERILYVYTKNFIEYYSPVDGRSFNNDRLNEDGSVAYEEIIDEV